MTTAAMLHYVLQVSLQCACAISFTGVRSGLLVNMSTTGSSSSAAQVVRMSLCPPTHYSPGGDSELWLTCFEMYAKQTSIPEEQWTCELLPLLEDEHTETHR